MAARLRVPRAQPSFLRPRPRRAWERPPAAVRSQQSGVGSRGECRGLSVSSGQGGHKKTGSPADGSPDPALPGSLLASLKLDSSSLGEGPPRLLSSDVGVAGLAGAWIGAPPLPQLTRLSQGMRPPCQSTLSPSESRLRRQREVSQAERRRRNRSNTVSHRGPSPWPSARSARGSLGHGDVARKGDSRERAIPHTTHTCQPLRPGLGARGPRDTHLQADSPPAPTWAAQRGLWAVALCCWPARAALSHCECQMS